VLAAGPGNGVMRECGMIVYVMRRKDMRREEKEVATRASYILFPRSSLPR
jgi:hypothetical protein